MTNVTIRMEDDDKAAFSEICKELGLSVSSLFNVFAKKVVREKKVPFELSVDPFFSSENMAALKQSIAELNQGEIEIHEPLEID